MSNQYTLQEDDAPKMPRESVGGYVSQHNLKYRDGFFHTMTPQESTMQAICLMFSTLDSVSQREVEQRLTVIHSSAQQKEQLRSEFYAHLKAWEEDTILQSSSTVIRLNENFKAIVAMGRAIVPFIVEELRKEPSHLNWVLTEIYGAPITDHPVTNEEACRLWIEKLSS